MNKTFCRFLSLLLIAAMLFSLSCEAFASTAIIDDSDIPPGAGDEPGPSNIDPPAHADNVLILPAELEKIVEEAFYGDDSLDEVVVPYGTTVIGPRAFAYSGVKKITIPNTVSAIAEDAFEGVQDIVICSMVSSYAESYADEYGLNWENSNRYWVDEAESFCRFQDFRSSLLSLSEMENTVPYIVTDSIINPDTLSLVQEYNDNLQALEQAIATYNGNILSARATLSDIESLVESAVIDESNSGFSVNAGDFSMTVTGDALSALNGTFEQESCSILEDGRTEAVLRNENGERFYLIVDEASVQVNREPYNIAKYAALEAQLPVLSASNLFLRSNDLLASSEEQYAFSNKVISTLGNMGDQVQLFVSGSSDIAFLADKVSNIAGDLNKRGVITNDAVVACRIFAYEAKNAAEELKNLEKIGKGFFKKLSPATSVSSTLLESTRIHELETILYHHGHPTDDEVKNTESYELYLTLMNVCVSAIKSYACSRALNLAGIIPQIKMVTTAITLTSLTVGNVSSSSADTLYKEARRMDDMLHYRIEGTVIDEDTKEPLQYVVVTCECAGHETMQDVTDANGVFSFEPLGSQGTLRFKAVGYGDDSLDYPRGGGVLAPDSDYKPSITLKQQPSLNGTITDADTNAPIAGATVTLDNNQTTTTNGNGQYAFSGVRQGNHTLKAEAPGYKRSEKTIRLTSEKEPCNFALERDESPLFGTVTDSKTGAVLSGVKVTLVTALNGTYTTYTNANGVYSFTNVPYDTHRLSFEKEGYEPLSSVSITMALIGNTEYNARMVAASAPPSPTPSPSPTPTPTTQPDIDYDNLRYTVNGDVLTVSGYGEMKDFNWGSKQWQNVKSVVIEPGVTSIGKRAFCNCEKITSVSLPDTLKTVNASAFFKCTALDSLSLPDSLTTIGECAFIYCSSLKTLTIPNSVTSLGKSAFDGCLSLEKVIIPENVTISFEVNSYGCSFTDCPKLKSAGPIGSGCNIEFGWKDSIPDFAFCSCNNLISVKLPYGIQRIGENALAGTALTSISIPNSVEIIGYNALSTDTLESITIPDSVISIGSDAFSGSRSLKSIKLPKHLSFLGDGAFHDCPLVSITVPDGLTSVPFWSFYNCTGLQSVYIPESITSIESYAFAGCDSLKDVYYAGTEEQWARVVIKSNNNPLYSSTVHFSLE